MLEKFFGVACKIVESDYAALGLLDEGEKGFACLLTEGLDPSLYDRQYERRLPVGLPYSMLAERRVFRERAYGWIYFANKPGGRDFSDKDERLVATLADMLASLYELERQVKERTAEL